MEFLLINHPLDCPICDQAGECKLQEQSTGYGRGYSRYIEQKNVKPKRTQLGPRVTLDDERCILCSRCVRFTSEISKSNALGIVQRGDASLVRAAEDGTDVWAEWEFAGTRRDGAAQVLRGVTVLGVEDGVAHWARFYMEPVDADATPVDAHIARTMT